jgi:hypothetical protein
MRRYAAFAIAGLAAVILLAAPAAAKDKTIEGRIKSFDCGDNCYLAIVDSKGKTIDGLCEAKACEPWNEVTEIPKALIGKKVRVTTGTGVQRDASGVVRGRMTAFKKIEFVQ